MINWQDLEERVDVYGQEVAAVGLEESERAELIEEFSSENNLRRWLASALVSLGVRIDSRAAEVIEISNN